MCLSFSLSENTQSSSQRNPIPTPRTQAHANVSTFLVMKVVSEMAWIVAKKKKKTKKKRGERQKATEAMNGAWCNFQAKQNSTAMRHKHKHTCTKGHRERARERGLKQPPHKSTTRANNSHTTFLSPNTHPKTTKQRQRQQQTAASILARGTIQLPHCPHCSMHAMFERRLLMHEHPWPVFNRETKGQEVKQQCVCV